jgi:Antp family protein
MDMSSYQFVNTLAQCYEQAGGVGGVPGAGAATPHEYYGMQYPACYSPATQAYSHQYATMMAGAGGGAPTQQQQQQADYSSPPSAAAAAAAAAVSLSHRRSPVSGSGLGGPGLPPVGAAGSLTPSGGGGSLNPLGSIIGGGTAVLPPQPNCKYADSNVGSPQDLSTNSSGGTPQPGGGPHGGGGLGGGGGPKSPESELEEDEEPSSPLSPSPGASGSGTKKEGGGDSKSNPPQIYPWMKRVHLGQSKSHLFSRHFCVTQ